MSILQPAINEKIVRYPLFGLETRYRRNGRYDPTTIDPATGTGSVKALKHAKYGDVWSLHGVAVREPSTEAPRLDLIPVIFTAGSHIPRLPSRSACIICFICMQPR